MLELTKENFKSEIKEGVTIVDFWAEWCGPCKAMAPLFETLSKEIKKVKFAKLNVDTHQDIASSSGVRGIPTFIIYKNGKEVERIVGMQSKSSLKEKIERTI